MRATIDDGDEVAPVLVARYLGDVPSLRPPSGSDDGNVCCLAARGHSVLGSGRRGCSRNSTTRRFGRSYWKHNVLQQGSKVRKSKGAAAASCVIVRSLAVARSSVCARRPARAAAAASHDVLPIGNVDY